MIYRTPHEKDYTIMDNGFLLDTSLSFTARGIMAYWLTLPSDENISIDETKRHGTNIRKDFLAAVKELKDKGYLKRRLLIDEDRVLCGSQNDLYETQDILVLTDEQQNSHKRKIKASPKKKPVKIYMASLAGRRLAEEFYEIVECRIKVEPDLNKWGLEFDKFMMLDGHKEQRISNLINYFHNDEWSRHHILSPGTFIRLWDQTWNRFEYERLRAAKKGSLPAGQQALQELLEICDE